MNYVSLYPSLIGTIYLSSKGNALTRVSFSELKGKEEDLPVFEITRKWLDLYFSKRQPDFLPPYQLGGSLFQRRVLELLLLIPYGTTFTYGELASKYENIYQVKRMSSQAIGSALKENPILILFPCHRIIGKGNRLTGYVGGIERKKRLLELEGMDVSLYRL